MRRADKPFSAPQTVEQVAMIHRFLSSNEAIYATIKSKGGKPTTQEARPRAQVWIEWHVELQNDIHLNSKL